jgi:hypothetical protein
VEFFSIDGFASDNLDLATASIRATLMNNTRTKNSDKIWHIKDLVFDNWKVDSVSTVEDTQGAKLDVLRASLSSMAKR